MTLPAPLSHPGRALAFALWRGLAIVALVASLGAQASTCESGALGACDTPSIDDLAAQGCDHLKQFIAGKKVGDEVILRVSRCRPPVRSVSNLKPAVAVIAADVEIDGPASHAAFLFVQTDARWRVADAVLNPAWMHGGFCDARFDFHWAPARQPAGERLTVGAERTCHAPLDRAEAAAGASDVASRECRTTRYQLKGEAVVRLSVVQTDRACTFRH